MSTLRLSLSVLNSLLRASVKKKKQERKTSKCFCDFRLAPIKISKQDSKS